MKSLCTHNDGDEFVVQIAGITFDFLTLHVTKGGLQHITSDAAIADHQIFSTWFPEALLAQSKAAGGDQHIGTSIDANSKVSGRLVKVRTKKLGTTPTGWGPQDS